MSDSRLSRRGKEMLVPSLSYMEEFQLYLNNPYDKDKNPNGYICFAVAENTLSWSDDLGKQYALEQSKAISQPLTKGYERYGSFSGVVSFKQALCSMLTKTGFVGEYKLDPDCICVASGVGAIVANATTVLTDIGDYVLVPSPSYPAFDNDVKLFPGSHLISVVRRPENNFKLTREALEETYRKCGNKAKILLLTSPDNPTGKTLSEEELDLAIAFTEEKEMHLFVDEVYGLSIYDSSQQPFISIFSHLKKRGRKLGNYIHVLYGMSKDFCASGLRIGCIYTENVEFRIAFSGACYFNMSAPDTQEYLARILNNEAYIKGFVQRNQQRLAQSYKKSCQLLDSIGVPYTKGTGGVYIWCDFRKLLEKKDWEGERALFKKMSHEAKVIFTPGRDFHPSEPGFFRFCFARAGEEELETAFQRLRKVLFNKSKM